MEAEPKVVSTRSCAVCREKAEKANLLRFVKEAGGNSFRWRLDIGAILPGRGVYLHASERCLRSRKLEKALPGLEGALEDVLRKAHGENGKQGKNAFVYVLDSRGAREGRGGTISGDRPVERQQTLARGASAIEKVLELLGKKLTLPRDMGKVTPGKEPAGKKKIRL